MVVPSTAPLVDGFQHVADLENPSESLVGHSPSNSHRVWHATVIALGSGLFRWGRLLLSLRIGGAEVRDPDRVWCSLEIFKHLSVWVRRVGTVVVRTADGRFAVQRRRSVQNILFGEAVAASWTDSKRFRFGVWVTGCH